MQSRKRQQGLTLISWVVILIVAGFLTLVGIKVAPVYIENYAVKSILESLKTEPFAARKSVRELKNTILNRLDINNIRTLDGDSITIKRDKSKTTIRIAYEERRHIIYNAAIVMTFDESVELTAN
ncbi:MAG: DUF4845 domain-containing protein [Candidatus Thiodiazotropha sp.]